MRTVTLTEQQWHQLRELVTQAANTAGLEQAEADGIDTLARALVASEHSNDINDARLDLEQALVRTEQISARAYIRGALDRLTRTQHPTL